MKAQNRTLPGIPMLLIAVFLVGLVFLMGFPTDAAQASAPSSGLLGDWIYNRQSNKCVTVMGPTKLLNGAPILQDVCSLQRLNGFDNQVWFLTYPTSPGAYTTIVNRGSGKCLKVPGGSTANGVNVTQSTCNGSSNQQWSVVWDNYGGYRIINRLSGKCLDGTTRSFLTGVYVQQQQCYYGRAHILMGASQLWKFQPFPINQ